MEKIEAKKRIEKLRAEIARLRFAYHVEDNPKVEDDIYDSLNKELNLILKKYPEFINLNAPENRVGGQPLDKFEKVKHEIRMLSMNDSFSFEEVKDWQERVFKLLNKNSIEYFCELKLDGLAVSLIYENGEFIRGATRGDGNIGEDITENLKMINTIPLKLKPPFANLIEVRGEAVLAQRRLKKINEIQKKEGKQIYANTRNLAAGTLRQLDPQIVKDRGLDFFAWDIVQGFDSKIKNHSEKHELLRKLGFQLSPYEKKSKNLEEAFGFINQISEIRPKLPYGTDGIVVAVDNLDFQKTLGIVGKAPRYCIAYKYPAEKATTKVLNITVNVGRTGVLTPLAHFNPTLVAGSTISKATLHNIDQIGRLDIRIGDTVVIQKAGDVIPKVVEVLKNLRNGKEKKFKMPEICPVCNSKVEKRESRTTSAAKDLSRKVFGRGRMRGQTITQETLSAPVFSVAYYCTNKNCSAKNRRGMEHFVNAFEIYEIGPKILDRLKDEGLISDSADLFTLEKSDLAGLERFGEKSAENIISSIESHKKVLLWRFIYALGILHVGEQTAQDVANHFKNLDNIMKAKIEEINEIENIGPIVSESIFNYFHDKSNLNFINKLLKNGVSYYYQKAESKKLFNKIFVLTGTLEMMSREEAKKKIIENGGHVSGSVSSKTSYLLAGNDPGSKYLEAKKLNIQIINEAEFLKML